MSNANAVNLDTDILDELDDIELLIAGAQNEADPRIEEEKQVEKEIVDLSKQSADIDDIDDLDAEIEQLEAEDSQPVEVSTLPPVAAKSQPKKKKSASTFNSSTDLIAFGKQLLGTQDFLLEAEDVNKEDATAENLERFNNVQQVKVREKLANLLMWFTGNKEMSRYTKATFDLILDKKTFSKTDVRNNLLDCGVKLGTASSQAGQMTHILTSAKLVKSSGANFEINEDSVLLGFYKEMQKETAAEA